MIRRGALVVFAATLACGCAGYAGRPPPGPTPLPDAWTPAAVLRAAVPRDEGEPVVLDDQDGLSPDEAALLAVERNPRLRAVRAERGLAHAELLEAGILPDPRLAGSLDFPTTEAGDEPRVLGYGVELAWNVTPLLSRGARVAAAMESTASVDLEVGWQEWQVAQAARLQVVRAVYVERRLRLSHGIESAWEERLEALRRAREDGAVTDIEVTDAESSLADARLRSLDLERQLVGERVELARALGVDPRERIVLDTSFTPSTDVQDGEGLLAALPRRRLDLVALQHAARSHDDALRAATLARFPEVEIGLQANRDVDRVDAAGFMVAIGLPFFDRNQGQVARASARRNQVDAEYTARLLEARADVVRVLEELEIAARQLTAARQASTAAETLAEQARTAAVAGALSPLLAARYSQRAHAAQLRTVEIEQALAELRIALAVASGTNVR